MKKKNLIVFLAAALLLMSCGNEKSANSEETLVFEDNTIKEIEASETVEAIETVEASETVEADKSVEITLSPSQLAGSWQMDGEKTQDNLKEHGSLLEMYGTGLSMGDGIEINEDSTISYYIGIGIGGEGTYEIEGNAIKAQITPYEVLGDFDNELILTYEIIDDTPYLVMEDNGEKIYWIQYNSEELIQETDTVEYVTLENPDWEYYNTDDKGQKAASTVHLEEVSIQKNDITDIENWFDVNGLNMADYTSYGADDNGLVNVLTINDDTYRYDLLGDNYASAYILNIYDKDSGELLKNIDFSQFRYADDFDESERDYVEQRIWWVQSKDNILYVSIGHNTYAVSSPHTGYVMAIDLNDMSVIWKTKPLASNSHTFEIIDENIVCGYGFTDEKDWINILDLHTGEIVEQIPIASKADYIICKDDILYVRTYNTDYTYKIIR